MRILFVVGGTYVAGAELHMLDLMRGLHAHGHEIHCSISGWGDGTFAGRLTGAGLPFTRVKLGYLSLRRPDWTLSTLLNYPRALAVHRKLSADFTPDWTYHVTTRTVSMLGPVLDPARTALHVIETVPEAGRGREAYSRAMARVGRWLANSEFVAGQLLDLGVPRERLTVSYPPVSIDGAAGAVEVQRWRAPRIGIVGQIIERKGHRDLLRALAPLAAAGREFTIEVYGSGPAEEQSALRELARAAGLESRVRFHGFVADREGIYHHLDIVVVPTRDEEAFGLVAAEPALRGLPVVASRGGGLPEIVADGETGLLFSRGDIGDLRSKLDRLLSDPALCARLGTAARGRVARLFSVESAVASVEHALG